MESPNETDDGARPRPTGWRRHEGLGLVLLIVAALGLRVLLGAEHGSPPGEPVTATAALDACVKDARAVNAPGVAAGDKVGAERMFRLLDDMRPADPDFPVTATVRGMEVPVAALHPCPLGARVQCLTAPTLLKTEVGTLDVDAGAPIEVSMMWELPDSDLVVTDGKVLVRGSMERGQIGPHPRPYECGPDRESTPADLAAPIPDAAHDRVKAVIAAANEIAGFPYKSGGGGQRFDGAERATGHDALSATLAALAGGEYVTGPMSLAELRELGLPGRGAWLTIVVCGHDPHLVVAGRRFGVDEPAGPRWRDPLPPKGCTHKYFPGF